MGVRPESFRPVVRDRSGVIDVHRIDEPLAVDAQGREIEAVRLEARQRLGDQLDRPLRPGDGAVGVVRLGMQRPVIGRDDVGVAAPADRILRIIIEHRAVVAEAVVARLITEALHLVARDRRRRIAEVDQQAQPDEIADGLPPRRRQQGTAGRRHGANHAHLLTPFLATLVAASTGHAQRGFASDGPGAFRAHAQAARHAGCGAVEPAAGALPAAAYCRRRRPAPLRSTRLPGSWSP